MTEVLLGDTGVSDLATLFSGVRPKVEASVLGPTRPALLPIAAVLGRRQELGAVHVGTHGAPGRAGFATGDCRRATPDRGGKQFAPYPEIGG